MIGLARQSSQLSVWFAQLPPPSETTQSPCGATTRRAASLHATRPIVFVLAVEVTVVSVASNLPSTSEREGLGAAGAALGFSGVQRRWRLEKT